MERFTISLEGQLAAAFDQWLAERGYATRSEAVRDLLRAEHYAVDWATDGDMADAALATQQYDLVLLDLGLPRRDGLALSLIHI